MERSFTNVVRYLMDECLPAIIRDNKYFMYPFYYYAYGGHNVEKAMNFKRLVYGWSAEEYGEFYRNLQSISRHRLTDLNKASLKIVRQRLNKAGKSLLDVGCGNGYFLEQVKDLGLSLHGVDILPEDVKRPYQYTCSRMEHLPFADKQFDIVTCFHTLEHVLDLSGAVRELKRVTARQLIVAVPCQRFFFYTLDEHVNFFPYKEKLTAALDIPRHTCEKIWGDWLYIADLTQGL